MNCNQCKIRTKVIDSRTNELSTWRRRECPKCKERITTIEKVIINAAVKSPQQLIKEIDSCLSQLKNKIEKPN